MTWRDIRESLDGDEDCGVGCGRGERWRRGEQGLNAVTGFLTHTYCSSTLPMSRQNQAASDKRCSTSLPLSDVAQPACLCQTLLNQPASVSHCSTSLPLSYIAKPVCLCHTLLNQPASVTQRSASPFLSHIAQPARFCQTLLNQPVSVTHCSTSLPLCQGNHDTASSPTLPLPGQT